MLAEQEALTILAPAPAANTTVKERAQKLTLAAATSANMAILPMPGTLGPDGVTVTGVMGGTFMRFIWLPTVAGEIVRLCWAPTAALAVATANDRAYPPGVEFSVWVDSGKDFIAGLSVGGGELSWNLG